MAGKLDVGMFAASLEFEQSLVKSRFSILQEEQLSKELFNMIRVKVRELLSSEIKCSKTSFRLSQCSDSDSELFNNA